MAKKLQHKNYPVIPESRLLVYTLKNNSNGEIFYIGSTQYPKERMVGHHARFGRDITMEELEIVKSEDGYSCTIGFALTTERFWVNMFISWGFNLKNKAYTRNTMQGKRRNTLNKKAA